MLHELPHSREKVSDINEIVRGKIRARRVELRMRQSELAEICGISREKMCRIEKGSQKSVSLRELRSIASALMVEVGWFFDPDAPPSPKVIPALRRALEDWSDESQIRLLSYIRGGGRFRGPCPA